MMGGVLVQDAITVGVDGSAAALDAVRWAAHEAVLHGVPLLLVSSLLVRRATFSDAVNLASGAFTDLERMGKHRLEIAKDVAESEIGDAPVKMHTSLVHGSPAPVLLDLASTARMLVLGSRGLGEFTGGLIGSVSTAVATHASCPVAVIRRTSAIDTRLAGPVVVGVDGSQRSEPAIAAAFEEASLRKADLVAVHAWSDFDLTRVFAEDSFDLDLGWSKIATAEKIVLSESLAGWYEQYPDVPVKKLVVRDRPVHHLVEQSRQAQLVVTGSRGRGGFASLLLGSTSRALLHAAECPLLIVR
jgi:nucleotide-binding universal stress UspA family protein